MTSPHTGEPTHAVFGFAGMLLKLFNQFKPEFAIMAVDSPGKTFRDDMYDQYKANRPPAPADLKSQEQRIFELTRLFGIPVLAVPGAEADDIIATLCRKTLTDDACGDMQIRVVSKDKDLEQLLCDRLTMFDIHTDTTVDAAALLRDKGITPAQVVDVLALMGDKVDNVPGVEGIGPKTAAALIGEFGSIDGMLANLDKITGKRRENIEKGREKLDLSRRLVMLKSDLDIPFSLDSARIGPIDAVGVRHMFEQLGFRRHEGDLAKLLASRGMTSATSAAPTATASATPLFPPTSPPVDDANIFSTNLFDAAAASTANSPEITEKTPPQPPLYPHPTPTLPPLNPSSSTPHLKAPTKPDSASYHCVRTRDELASLVSTLRDQSLISLDTETIGLGHCAKLCGLSFAWRAGHGVYIPLCSPQPETHLGEATVLNALRPVLQDATIAKTGHNLKYDILVLRHAGVEVRGVAFDSMIASHLLLKPVHNLQALALTELNHQQISITELIGEASKAGPLLETQRTMDQAPLDRITCYAADDAEVSLRLHQLFAPQLEAQGMSELASRVEMPLVEVLAEMEHHGIRVDPVVLQEQRAALTLRIEILREEICQHAGANFNPDSPKQLAELLFKQMGLPVVKRNKTGPSTDVEVIEKLAERDDLTPPQNAVLSRIVEYRQFTKLVNTYLGNLRDSINADTGRVHAQFMQTGAATGRLSSHSPNLQNIPIRTEIGRQIRKAFVAEPGHTLISADYSQIELRVLAHLSQDPALIEAFEKDQDIHAAVAAQVFHTPLEDVTREQRASAKVINFGIVYGVTPYGLARRIEGLDVEAAKKLINDYRHRFAGINAFLDRCIEQAQATEYVTTILNRRRRIREINSRNGNVKALGERLAINSVVQGSAADLIKLAMVNLHRRIVAEKLPLKLLLQIHDELVLEAPAPEAQAMARIVIEEMESAMTLRVPLKVEAGLGDNWLDAK